MELDPALVAARWAWYGAATALFGASLFPLYAGAGGGREGLMPRVAAPALAFAALAAASLWLLAFAASIGEPGDVLGTVRAILAETSFGPAWLVRLCAAAVALGFALAGHNALVAAAMLAALACEGWSGHAAAWSLSGRVAQAVHVVCVAAWLGGLLPLAALVVRARRSAGEVAATAEALRRFSACAMAFVALIALTGAFNAWRLLGGWPELASAYGRTLVVKLALFAAMVALAMANRFRLMPRLERRQERALVTLSRTILAEQLVGAAVLFDVSALGLMDPHA